MLGTGDHPHQDVRGTPLVGTLTEEGTSAQCRPARFHDPGQGLVLFRHQGGDSVIDKILVKLRDFRFLLVC